MPDIWQMGISAPCLQFFSQLDGLALAAIPLPTRHKLQEFSSESACRTSTYSLSPHKQSTSTLMAAPGHTVRRRANNHSTTGRGRGQKEGVETTGDFRFELWDSNEFFISCN
jgi:hypothetical protein